MDIISSLAIISFAALIHASFQLSVSVLTLISGHALGSQKSHRRLVALTASFVFGAVLMSLLLLSTIALVANQFTDGSIGNYLWIAACSLLIGVGFAVMFLYYRNEDGTGLWIPESFADYLMRRTKATKSTTETFALGQTSVISEILFISAPLLVSALTLVQLPAGWQLIGIAVYAVISALPLILIWILVNSGHRLSAIQKWRESNKHFIQLASGSGLIILAVFVYTWMVLSSGVNLS
ncbi:hypothetical protein B7Y94_00690 [Candidatus Saccharibacteria bacterium 32-49-12]|nr:MAG: hypothetical protein B7Y94_00690 [Candidatus Saccharibacteria bacterium 32-49-12]